MNRNAISKTGGNSLKIYKNVVVWDSERSKAELCDVAVDGAAFAKIAAAGTLNGEACFDGKGRAALLPGFVNAHGHASMTLLRGLGEDLPLMEWLEKRIWPAEEKLTAEYAKAGAKQAMLEMLSTGTTCFADMYFFMEGIAEAALEAGIRCGLSRGMIDDKDGTKLRENIKLAEQYNGAGEGLVNVQLGPHAPYTMTFYMLRNVAESAISKRLGIQLHWLETKEEWQHTTMYGKLTPEQCLESSGLTRVKNLVLSHCVWIDEEKYGFYKKDNITFVSNPKSNLKLGSGVAPTANYLKAGINVALGTDGASSNNSLDMWEEMRFAALTQKGYFMNPVRLKAEEALKMATVAGAKALGFEKTGLIKEGWKADFMLVDLDAPQYMGWNEENLAGYIVYSGSSKDVAATVVNGKTLYERGEFMTLDKERVMADALAARKGMIG